VKLFCEQLGYRYLGNLEDKPDNSNIEVPQLTRYLTAKGYDHDQINKALDRLQSAANNHGQDLYHNNKAVYELLRYGVQTKTEAGLPTDTVHVIDWRHPEQNDFYIAEEVTVFGKKEKRPDIVLYVNGIAISVLELKNSRVSIGDGIRQNLANQQPEFIEKFFSTIQFVFAGNDSEGLQYGTIGTPEKFFLKWKEDEADNNGYKLDKYLAKICNKQRLIELLYDFVLFDGRRQEIAARASVFRRQSRAGACAPQGRRHHLAHPGQRQKYRHGAAGPNGYWRIIRMPASPSSPTRDELDKQIESVFRDAGEAIYRTHSGARSDGTTGASHTAFAVLAGAQVRQT
jgi:type I restriction enzyme R subunit